jgi:hypothetical protein
VNSYRYIAAPWVAIAVLLFGTCAVAASAPPRGGAHWIERAREPALLCAISPTWRCGECLIGGKAINVADNNGNPWIDALLNSLYREVEEEGSARVEALSRDSGSKSLAIPLLATSMRQTIVAGKRPFHIAWVGGKPPFSAELIGPSGATVARWPQTTEHSVAATVSLEEGFYELSVTDASGQPVFGAFEATPQPPMVDRRGVEQLPPDLGAALLAARLADVDDGAWQLEAYERLTAEPGGEAARIIAKRLAQGLSVSELRQQGAQLR